MTVYVKQEKHISLKKVKPFNSLLRSRFLGCHATFPPLLKGGGGEGEALRDIPKNGCAEETNLEPHGLNKKLSTFLLHQLSMFRSFVLLITVHYYFSGCNVFPYF